jgi:hypothetical protein
LKNETTLYSRVMLLYERIVSLVLCLFFFENIWKTPFLFFLLLRFVSIKKKKKLKAIDKTLWSNIRIVRWLFYSLKKNQNMYLRVKLSFVEDSLDIIKLIGVKFIYIFILTQKPLKTRKKIFTFVHGFFFIFSIFFCKVKLCLHH